MSESTLFELSVPAAQITKHKRTGAKRAARQVEARPAQEDAQSEQAYPIKPKKPKPDYPHARCGCTDY